MFANTKRQKRSKQKITIYIFVLGIVMCIMFFSIFLYFFKKTSFISPLGKIDNNIAMVEEKLKEKNIPFSHVLALSNSVYQVNIPDNRDIKLSSVKDIDKQISSLQRILNQLTIEGKQFKSIDFRFSEPVVSF